MDWKEIKNPPKEKFGWFVVAVVPGNHSGAVHGDKTDLAGDNSWREQYGFTKAWLNNGEWYEPNHTGNRSYEITNLVTHWDYPPAVPELTKTHYGGKDSRFYGKPTEEEITKIAEKEFLKTGLSRFKKKVFIEGFLKSFEFLGFC